MGRFLSEIGFGVVAAETKREATFVVRVVFIQVVFQAAQTSDIAVDVAPEIERQLFLK